METNQEEKELDKITPYQKLQMILSEKDKGKMTERASSNIDNLLGIEYKETFLDKLKSFFKKIDSKIFQKGQKIQGRYQKRN
jgi:ABC-type lipoprotein release transport system permease subunit